MSKKILKKYLEFLNEHVIQDPNRQHNVHYQLTKSIKSIIIIFTTQKIIIFNSPLFIKEVNNGR